MGTKCRIVVYGSGETAAADACAAAFDRVAQLEGVMSDYRADSEASVVLGREPGVWHRVSRDFVDVLVRSGEVYRASDGAFDPAIGPLTRLWRETRRTGHAPDPGTLASARARSGFSMIELEPDEGLIRFSRSGMGLDFGGIGKGYAADEALRVLGARGFRIALIDFGGDLVVGDAPPDDPRGWVLEVRDGMGRPRTVRLANAAIATSGDLEQFVEIDGVRYAHIIDPRTGLGLSRRTAATVIANSGTLADALASAACVLGPDKVGPLRKAYPDAMIEVIVDPGG